MAGERTRRPDFNARRSARRRASLTFALLHYGPFGEYVREHFLHPHELSSHDYGVDLLGACTAGTRPSIVAFDIPVDDNGPAVEAACWYLWAAAKDELTRNACGGFDGQGVGRRRAPSATSRTSIAPNSADGHG